MVEGFGIERFGQDFWKRGIEVVGDLEQPLVQANRSAPRAFTRDTAMPQKRPSSAQRTGARITKIATFTSGPPAAVMKWARQWCGGRKIWDSSVSA